MPIPVASCSSPQRRGGHRGIRVGDLRHQRDRSTRNRGKQASRLRHDGAGVSFGEAQYVRQASRRRDRVGHLVGLVGAQRRGFTEDAQRDETVASVGGERVDLVAQRGDVDAETVVEGGGQHAPKARGEGAIHRMSLPR